ncbi:MAG: hypothetical protein IT371_09940 [Deltaproteobacteria bacterium]|nr:hypothetical protein [Deltaproteobacteria bacterium]
MSAATEEKPQPSLYEAEAAAAAMRAGLTAGQLERELTLTVAALRAAGREDLVRDVEKAGEFLRLSSMRLAVVVRVIGEGRR